MRGLTRLRFLVFLSATVLAFGLAGDFVFLSAAALAAFGFVDTLAGPGHGRSKRRGEGGTGREESGTSSDAATPAAQIPGEAADVVWLRNSPHERPVLY